MKTYRLIRRSHKSANISVLALVKRGDAVERVSAQIRKADLDPDQFGEVVEYDTKTEDHVIAHELLRRVRGLTGRYVYSHGRRGKRELAPAIPARGAGPQTILAINSQELHSAIQRTLHATTNRDSAGRMIGTKFKRRTPAMYW